MLMSSSLVTDKHYFLVESYLQKPVVLFRHAYLLIPSYEQLLIKGSLEVALTHLNF